MTWCKSDISSSSQLRFKSFVLLGSHPLLPVGQTSTAFRRSEITVKVFLGIGKLFLSLSSFFFFFSPSPVLMAPSEPSAVGVVVTKAPGA